MLSQMPGNIQSTFGESPLQDIPNSEDQLPSLGNYVIILRRFFLLHPAAKNIMSPFDTEELLVERLPLLLPFFEPNALVAIARTASERQLPQPTLAALERLPASFVDSHICLTMGHCLRSLNRHTEAAEAYRRALLYSEESRLPEAEQALAAALRITKQYEEALTAYRHALTLEPLEPRCRARLLHGSAECLLQIGKPTESLTLLFEAYYLCPESRVVLRALAWSALMAERYDVAARHYSTILQSAWVTSVDVLNAAHTAWLSHNIAQAAALYRRAATMPSPALLETDISLLRQKGIGEEELLLMEDLVDFVP